MGSLPRRTTRIALSLAIVGSMFGIGGTAHAGAATTCPPKLLILSAFPAEMDAWLRAVPNFNPKRAVNVNGHWFYPGTLQGNNVIMAMTGIGPVNATNTTRAAVTHFRCGSTSAITGVVFSGVAGSTHNIGDVTVPDRWTDDGGHTWFTPDAAMYSIADQIHSTVALERRAPVGDPACACFPKDPSKVTFVSMPRQPRVWMGGNGNTTDPVFGRAFPCIPGGGDTFGCSPCLDKLRSVPSALGLPGALLPFVDPLLFLQFFQSPPATTSNTVADDEETGAVARVAHDNGIPWLGIRAVSDGPGDPLHTPGFPVSFFIYRQISADNAGRMTLAFLKAWAAH